MQVLLHGDRDRRLELRADTMSFVDRMVVEPIAEALVRWRGVDFRENIADDHLPELRSPLSRAEARGCGAVVHQILDAAGRPGGVQGVRGFDDRLVDRL